MRKLALDRLIQYTFEKYEKEFNMTVGQMMAHLFIDNQKDFKTTKYIYNILQSMFEKVSPELRGDVYLDFVMTLDENNIKYDEGDFH